MSVTKRVITLTLTCTFVTVGCLIALSHLGWAGTCMPVSYPLPLMNFIILGTFSLPALISLGSMLILAALIYLSLRTRMLRWLVASHIALLVHGLICFATFTFCAGAASV